MNFEQQSYGNRQEAGTGAPQLARLDGAVEYPLSLNQRYMWFECQLDPDSNLYNLGVRLTIEGPLDVRLFLQAVQAVVDRHEILRTVFSVSADNPVQRVVAKVRVHCPILDLTSLPQAPQHVTERLYALTQETFDLSKPPLLRMELLHRGGLEHHFIFVFHHLLLDAFYAGQLMSEFLTTYERLRRNETMPAPMRFQFGDFCVWQQERQRRGLLDSTVDFWEQQLHEPLPDVPLPCDGTAPMPRVFRSGHAFVLDAAAVSSLRTIGRRNRTTVFRTVLAAFVVFLTSLLDSDETMIDIDVSTRPRDLNQVIGSFANVLPARFRVDPFQTFCDLLSSVDTQLRCVAEHRELPVRQLARKLKSRRDAARPFTSVQVTQLGEMDFYCGGLHVVGDALMNGTVHDLWLTVMEREEKIEIVFVYCEQLFYRSRVAGWAESFNKLLLEIASRPQASLLELTMSAGLEAEELGVSAATS